MENVHLSSYSHFNDGSSVHHVLESKLFYVFFTIISSSDRDPWAGMCCSIAYAIIWHMQTTWIDVNADIKMWVYCHVVLRHKLAHTAFCTALFSSMILYENMMKNHLEQSAFVLCKITKFTSTDRGLELLEFVSCIPFWWSFEKFDIKSILMHFLRNVYVWDSYVTQQSVTFKRRILSQFTFTDFDH